MLLLIILINSLYIYIYDYINYKSIHHTTQEKQELNFE